MLMSCKKGASMAALKVTVCLLGDDEFVAAISLPEKYLSRSVQRALVAPVLKSCAAKRGTSKRQQSAAGSGSRSRRTSGCATWPSATTSCRRRRGYTRWRAGTQLVDQACGGGLSI